LADREIQADLKTSPVNRQRTTASTGPAALLLLPQAGSAANVHLTVAFDANWLFRRADGSCAE
jgi:hypothetical protein